MPFFSLSKSWILGTGQVGGATPVLIHSQQSKRRAFLGWGGGGGALTLHRFEEVLEICSFSRPWTCSVKGSVGQELNKRHFCWFLFFFLLLFFLMLHLEALRLC